MTVVGCRFGDVKIVREELLFCACYEFHIIHHPSHTALKSNTTLSRMDQVKDKLVLLRSKLNQIPALQQAEQATQVPKEYLVLGGGSLFILLIFFGIGAAVLCTLVGFLYPAFKSLESIENKNRGDDVQWLVYWVIFTFYTIVEAFGDFLLYWIPFYYAFKLAFLLWAMLPQTKGAKFLYDSFLKDFLKKESRIESAMADAKKSAESTASELIG